MSKPESDLIPLETVLEQDSKLLRILSTITVESVNRVTRSFGYTTLSIRRLENSNGVINAIYFVEAESNGRRREFVLRVTNPWLRWQHSMQRNESFVLRMLERWNAACTSDELRIPAPKMVSSSSDAATSLLGCEYSLHEKMDGENASDVVKSLNMDQRRVFWQDWLRIIGAIRSIPAAFVFDGMTGAELDRASNMTGSFSKMPDGLGPIIRDGPGLGPSERLSSQMLEGLRKGLADLESSDTLPKCVGEDQIRLVAGRVRDLLLMLEDGRLDAERIWPSTPPFGLVHDDLHLGNILIDPTTGHITAILDWDRAHWGHSNDLANEWSCALIDDLFGSGESGEGDGEDLDSERTELPSEEKEQRAVANKEARLLVESRFPEDLSMKLRSSWCPLVETLNWTANIVATWLGAPVLDEKQNALQRDLDVFKSIHEPMLKEFVSLLDELDLEMAKKEDAFAAVDE